MSRIKPKPTSFAGYFHDVIFIDAIPGSGKSLLGPIISSFQNVERQTMGLYTIEHLLAANYLAICDPSLAQQLIQQLVAFNHHNMFIGRNVNMKLSDISGPLSNPFRLRYFLRLFLGPKGTDEDINIINESNIAPLIKTHACIYNISLLRTTFDSRLKFIEFVRHPLDTIESWINAVNNNRHGIRGYSLRLDNSHLVYDYLDDLNTPDTSPLKQYNKLFSSLRNSLVPNSSDFLLLPFESFLCNSKVCIDALTRFLRRQPISYQLRRTLSLQNCDRYKYLYSAVDSINYRLHGGEPSFLIKSRENTLSNIVGNFPSEDVNTFIDHITWYTHFFNQFTFDKN